MKLENIIKVAWNERSKKYGKKIEGVLPKSLDPLINDYLDKWMFETIERYVEDDKKLNILDLGCGYGRLSKQIIKKFPEVKVVGIDIAKSYVDIFNKTLSPRGRAYVGDIKKLPFKSETFDLVFIATSLMYLIEKEDQVACIREVRRVLKEKGKFVIIERNPLGHRIITFGGLVSILRGQKYKEIPSVSFKKKYLKSVLEKNLGKVVQVKGIPIWTLTLPVQILLLRVDKSLTRLFLKMIYYFDNLINMENLSLYISYTGFKR
ncbi:MAG: membrane-associated protein [uncultured bacterium]|uniref:Membrane-associated protein n=3 Tax=Candidatus Daviesiibacteriota TaxID=1752718 RepID=A0A0G0I3H4_9BACT|nr:MAG: membrane-associated protein [uncultured bacterium]KKQ10631.1 MAG: Membrane-associated protein [Candidatus Daviesbacteria bacterium GW2011_GWB1_36_5]KKQ15104.1 MAG: Membrane-associated protein [Candidatus Daviesbacteria bacterium GW2011_GWA1_36_8]OGE17821.1 MAG: hypothetical protein A2858_03700 [Candidatus Daviesbacteria bacterium RIFCSPHIGHO2_01_FULL_36_37]